MAARPSTCTACHAALPREVGVVLTIGRREITVPGTAAHPTDGDSPLRRNFPVYPSSESGPALAAGADLRHDRRPAGRRRCTGRPARRCGRGDRVAAIRADRGPDRVAPPSLADHLSPGPGQRARPGHVPGNLPGTRPPCQARRPRAPPSDQCQTGSGHSSRPQCQQSDTGAGTDEPTTSPAL